MTPARRSAIVAAAVRLAELRRRQAIAQSPGAASSNAAPRPGGPTRLEELAALRAIDVAVFGPEPGSEGNRG